MHRKPIVLEDVSEKFTKGQADVRRGVIGIAAVNDNVESEKGTCRIEERTVCEAVRSLGEQISRSMITERAKQRKPNQVRD